MVKRVHIVFVVMLASVARLNAQNAGFVNSLNQLQDTRVKSLDEFVERFNGNEVPEFIRNSVAPQNRQTYIEALFDTVLFHGGNSAKRSTIEGFVSAVVADSIMLDMHDSTCYAEARCIFVYKGKEVVLNVVLQYENIRDYYYDWAIVGVNGMEQAGLFAPRRDGYISPVQHEFHFAELSKSFPHMIAYCRQNYSPDQLSYLMALVEGGVLRFKSCEYHQYYFFSVPKYLFIVSLKNRVDINSGWLISDVVEIPQRESRRVINSFLGKHE